MDTQRRLLEIPSRKERRGVLMAYFIPTATHEDTGRKRKTTMFRATAMLEIQQEPRYAAGRKSFKSVTTIAPVKE